MEQTDGDPIPIQQVLAQINYQCLYWCITKPKIVLVN